MLKLLDGMYLGLRISEGHRLATFYIIPSMFFNIIIDHGSALWYAILIFMNIVLIAMVYTVLNYNRLMKENIIMLV